MIVTTGRVPFAKGLIVDARDPRDFGHLDMMPVSILRAQDHLNLPSSVDLRRFDSPIQDQGELGACTAFAWCALVENSMKQQKRFVKLSELDLYYEERAIEGTISEDSGAQIRDGGKALKTNGVCLEAYWPYVVGRFTERPEYPEHMGESINGYYRCTNLQEIKSTLRYGHPVVIGVDVYESFESDTSIKTGVVPMPNPQNEQLLGGHALCAVGYRDGLRHVIVKNSWGMVGDKGYFYLPYSYFEPFNHMPFGYCSDAWTAQV